MHRPIILPWLVAAGLSAPALAQQQPAPADALTRTTWTACSRCHATPDKRIAHDERWIGLNATTTCLTGEAATSANRRRLMSFLKAGAAPVSRLIQTPAKTDTRATAAATDNGSLHVPAHAGSAYLREKPGPTKNSTTPKTLRLYWDAADKGTTLSLPAGSYDLIGYCFYREDDAGHQWTASATVQEDTAPDAIVVTGAEPAKLPAAPTMFHELNATADGQDLAIQFQMRNAAGDRMTLTRDGSLVKPSWTVFDEHADTKLASGRFVPS